MELTRGTIFVTADVEIGLLEEMHIERWYRPGLHGVYIRKHTEYDVTYPKEERKHIVKITLDDDMAHNFWVFESIIQERCMWNSV